MFSKSIINRGIESILCQNGGYYDSKKHGGLR